MAYHKLPSWTDYWKNDQDLDLCVPFISATMTRNRFAEILSNLHVNDNLSIPEGNKDKLYKLRPLIEAINNKYRRLYNVSRRLSVDESMISFKGRHSIKQYNPMKPIKRGYKLWMRADMDGYITKFDVYQGKVSDARKSSAEDDESSNFGLGENIVKEMTDDLLNKNHEVYFDNFFTSVPLIEYLKTNDVNAVGTVRTIRKALPLGMDEVLDRGNVIIVCQRMVLSCSSGKTTSVFLFCPISMGQRSHQYKEPRRMVQSPSFPVLKLLLTTTNSCVE